MSQDVSAPSNPLCGVCAGTLPPWLAQSFAPGGAEALLLSHNQFNGSLPPEWGASGVAWRELSLAGNYLSGGLPGSWSNLTRVAERFDLSHNLLNGTLPQQLWEVQPEHAGRCG